MKGKVGCWILLGATVSAGLSLPGCGGGSSAPLLPAIAVSVSPPSPTVSQGATQSFTASVTGTTNTVLRWSIQEGAAGGAITDTGVYTAPSTAGTFHVVATSQADSTKSATATVTVPSVSVAISPSAAMVDQGATASFGATVSGTVINTSVTWSVQEGTAGGTVSSVGLYTAPQASGTFHLVATSQADPTKSGVSTITVPVVTVSVSPMSDTLGPNGSRTFVATIHGITVNPNPNVIWSVEEGAAGGSITSGGIYTAPTTTGTFHVVAVDIANPTVSSEAIVTVVSSGFTATANMETPRVGHTATLLLNGKVLIAGGEDTGSLPLQTAELFDPTTNTFSSTGDMTSGRANHTATLLANGKVLLSGGENNLGTSSSVTASAELYDPATGTFAATGPMAVARTRHTATLLADGRVLLAGGVNSGVASAAEIYDPATSTSTSTGSLVFARFNHAAALLADGKVLVAGGEDVNLEDVFSAELYDPASGTFTVTGAMIDSREMFTLTLLPNGKVLAAGGIQEFSGCSISDCLPNELSNVDLYDPSAGVFTAASSMQQPHGGHTATVLPTGEVLIAGGATFAVELFDLMSGTFSLSGSLEVSRTGHTATLLNDGRVLVTGGTLITGGTFATGLTDLSGNALSTAEIYK